MRQGGDGKVQAEDEPDEKSHCEADESTARQTGVHAVPGAGIKAIGMQRAGVVARDKLKSEAKAGSDATKDAAGYGDGAG